MAYKMKAGIEGPFKKNFPSTFKKDGDGVISKIKKKVKKVANESLLLNPRSADEVIKDRADSQVYTASMKQDRKEGKKSKTTQFYENKAKKTRPNKKDRY
jgi:hypothetical protein